MAEVLQDAWTRDVGLMIAGWLVGTVVAIVLLLTVIRWAFV